MRPKLIGALLCLLCSMAVASDMTHEETAVRTAYAKFSFASEEGVIGRLAFEANGGTPLSRYAGMTADQRFAAARVSFVLSNFVVGDIGEILDRRAIDLITPSVGEYVLEGSIGIGEIREPGLAAHWGTLDASWQEPHQLGGAEEGRIALQNIKVDDLYRLQWQRPRPKDIWQRYASYSVTVTFQGRSRGPYKALFIFGRDDKGNEIVEVQDATVPGLFGALYEHLFPDALVLSHLRKYPVVTNWLKAHQVSGPSCSVGQGDVCCDLVRLTCGPGSQDVAAGLSRPWPDPSSPMPPMTNILAPNPDGSAPHGMPYGWVAPKQPE
ncbi:MAG: hypothetical protein ABSG70_05145 [Terriglobales bacterium]|jgi:hypothetical protein